MNVVNMDKWKETQSVRDLTAWYNGNNIPCALDSQQTVTLTGLRGVPAQAKAELDIKDEES